MTRRRRLRPLVSYRQGLAIRAIQTFLRDAREADAVLPLAARHIPFTEFNELTGLTEQLALGERHAS